MWCTQTLVQAFAKTCELTDHNIYKDNCKILEVNSPFYSAKIRPFPSCAGSQFWAYTEIKYKTSHRKMGWRQRRQTANMHMCGDRYATTTLTLTPTPPSWSYYMPIEVKQPPLDPVVDVTKLFKSAHPKTRPSLPWFASGHAWRRHSSATTARIDACQPRIASSWNARSIWYTTQNLNRKSLDGVGATRGCGTFDQNGPKTATGMRPQHLHSLQYCQNQAGTCLLQ